MKKMIALAALAAAMAGATQAQAGLRVDVHAGLDHTTVKQRTDVGTSGATTEQSDDGVIYGGEIGYDVAFAGLIVGAYGGIEGASTKECAEVFTEVETCTKAGRNFTLGARVGVHVMPRLLVYAKGGYSNGEVRTDSIDHVEKETVTMSQDMDGYHLGAGVQLDLLSNVYAKLEYVRTDYKDYALKQGDATIHTGVDRDNVVLGVGWRF